MNVYLKRACHRTWQVRSWPWVEQKPH